MKAESGATKEEMQEFRDECCKRLQDALGLPYKKRKRSAMETREIVADAGAETSLVKGSVRISGRDASKKNSSVNGMYVLLDEKVDGMPAYKQVGTGPPRFLFFAVHKMRWKISDELGDTKKGFAYVEAQDAGVSGPHGKSLQGSWYVFDGKESGYSKDAALSCILEGEDETVARLDKSAAITAEDESDESETSGSSESSSSSKQASQGNDNSKNEDDEVDRRDEQNVSKEKEKRDEGVGASRAPVRGRVCAKMLARGHYRCLCHFTRVQDCPRRNA